MRMDGSAIRSERRWVGMRPLLAFAEVGFTLCGLVFECEMAKGSSSFSARAEFDGGSTNFLGVSALTLPLDLVVFARLGKWLRWGSTNPFPLILCGGGDNADNGREIDRDEGRSAFEERGTPLGSVRLSLESELNGKGVMMSVEDEAEAGEGCSGVALRSPSVDVMAGTTRVEAKCCRSAQRAYRR